MSLSRNLVFFINPPNTNDLRVATTSRGEVSRGVQHTDWANFPHLGILSLASYVDSLPNLEALYIDGVIQPLDRIVDAVVQRARQTLAVCLSTITANYDAALVIARRVKLVDPNIKIILGNDHFSAMDDKILARHREVVDCGFIGNEVYSSLGSYLQDAQSGGERNSYPGWARWSGGRSERHPQIREPVYRLIDYRLIDRTLPHSDVYAANFSRRLSHRIRQLTGQQVRRGVPVEIARGCIKFSGDDACSFCSIQYGGMWKNELGARDAWQTIFRAWSAGYDYLYITADELPLTFARLMLDMAESPPDWWRELSPENRPMLVGYARADGMEKEAVLRAMRSIGFRILFVGVDAGTSLSLHALNKPLRSKNGRAAAEKMFASNMRAIENARKHEIKIKAGFVLGHLGMTQQLLDDNIATYVMFLQNGRDVIVSADIELLSPEPGSKDFRYLTEPPAALRLSEQLDLTISSRERLDEFSRKYKNRDSFDREEAIEDYIKVMMPTLSKAALAGARDRVRAECIRLGIVIGAEI